MAAPGHPVRAGRPSDSQRRRLDLPFESRMDVAREEAPDRRRWWYAAGAAAALAVVAVVLLRLDPAAPALERSAVLMGIVERGTLVQQVRGPGTLVPERVRIVSALTAGRVERVLSEPGQEVEPETVLLELSNPEVELEALQAQQQLTEAHGRHMELKRSLGTEVLMQEAAVADARAVQLDARRTAAADSVLARRGLISRNDALRSREQADAAAARLEAESRRLELLQSTVDAQIAVQEEQVDRLRSIHEYQRRRVASMRVAAGDAGVLQDLTLEVGQWVQSGTVLARVARPGELRAELRIPQTQARDVTVGQRALVDTRRDTIPGRVQRVDPNVQAGAVLVEVALEGPLPPGARPDLTVDGSVEVQRLDDVLHVPRPPQAQADTRTGVFRLAADGEHAERVPVRFGAGSVNRIQVLEGLREGDRILVSDVSRWDDEPRLRIR